MIEFQSIYKHYADTVALQPLDLRIDAGSVFGIVGQSGAGKSTLLRLINRLETASGGRLLIDDVDVTALDAGGLRQLRRRIGMIFQHFNLLSSATVADNVALPLRLYGERSRTAIADRVAHLLDRVGLLELAGRYPAQLSGGQKQRVGIARALATQPGILLCDEATSALDPQTTASVLDLLADLQGELGLTIVLITHEMDVVRRICDRVAVLDAGRLVETGAVADVFLDPQHAVTQRFLDESGLGAQAIEPAMLERTPGRVVRLNFRGDSTHSPLFASVMRDCGVDFNLLAGRVDRIRDLPCGQLTVALAGGDIDQALSRLRAAEVRVDLIRSEVA